MGSKLGTKQDIKSRKSKVWEPIKNNIKFFRSKKISIKHKIRIFNTYVETIFLYNSELWTLNKTLEKTIDSFHRRLLRIAINNKYQPPQNEEHQFTWSDLDWTLTKKHGVMSNEKLYELTQQEPWSKKIRRRRLRLLGHILRLHPETPVKKALDISAQHQKKVKGGQRLTWISLVMKDLTPTREEHNISSNFNLQTLEELTVLADRDTWKREIGRSMEGHL